MNERADLWVRGISRHAYRRVSHVEMVNECADSRGKSALLHTFCTRNPLRAKAIHRLCGKVDLQIPERQIHHA